MKIIDIHNLNSQQGSWGIDYYLEENKLTGRAERKEKTDKHQRTIPHDKYLLEKLGIEEGSILLVIAGYYGDWANALAEAGCKIIYSDISKDLTNVVL